MAFLRLPWRAQHAVPLRTEAAAGFVHSRHDARAGAKIDLLPERLKPVCY